jgi:hypothetical protein
MTSASPRKLTLLVKLIPYILRQLADRSLLLRRRSLVLNKVEGNSAAVKLCGIAPLAMAAKESGSSRLQHDLHDVSFLQSRE